MSTPITARYCDQSTLASQTVTLEVIESRQLRVVGSSVDRTVLLTDLRMTSRLGSIPRFITLPRGGVIEAESSEALAAMIEQGGARAASARLLHSLESHSIVAAVALVLLVASIGLALWRGLPALARRVAYAAPTSVEKAAGRTAFGLFDQHLRGTALPPRDQRRASDIFTRVVRSRPLHVEPWLIFRSLNVPNAFAFPGGVVVVSDSLVDLMLRQPKGEDLLAAVFAHELAHVEHRHGLQLVLRQSTALVTVATITGDLSSLTAFSASLPFLLIQRGYARDFEREADATALEYLRALKIEPRALAEALELLETQRPASGADFTYLSTHPSTAERTQLLRSSARPSQ